MAGRFDVGFSLNPTTNAPLDTRSTGLTEAAPGYATAQPHEQRPTDATAYEGLLRYDKQYPIYGSDGVTVESRAGGVFQVYRKDAAGDLGWENAGFHMGGTPLGGVGVPGLTGEAFAAVGLQNGTLVGGAHTNTGYLKAKQVELFSTVGQKHWGQATGEFGERNADLDAGVTAHYGNKEFVPKEAIHHRIEQVRNQITGLSGVARTHLDTLKELGDALSDGTDVATAVTVQISDMKTYSGSKMQLNNIFTTTRRATQTDVDAAAAESPSREIALDSLITENTELGGTDSLLGAKRTILPSDVVDTTRFASGAMKIPRGTTVAELRTHFPSLESLIAAMLDLKAAPVTFYTGSHTDPQNLILGESLVRSYDTGSNGSATRVLVGVTVTLKHKLTLNRGYYRQTVATSASPNTFVFPKLTAGGDDATQNNPAYGTLTKFEVTKFANSGTLVEVGATDISTHATSDAIEIVYLAASDDSHLFDTIVKKEAGKVKATLAEGPEYFNSAGLGFSRASRVWNVAANNTTYQSYAPVFIGFDVPTSGASISSTVNTEAGLRVNDATFNISGTQMPTAEQAAGDEVDSDTTYVMVHQIYHNHHLSPTPTPAERKSEYVLIPKIKTTAPTKVEVSKYNDMGSTGYTTLDASDYTFEDWQVKVTGPGGTEATIAYWKWHFHGQGTTADNPTTWLGTREIVTAAAAAADAALDDPVGLVEGVQNDSATASAHTFKITL